MICKICQSEGKKSRVQSLGCSTTLMGCSPYYDEDGKYHYHDYNTSNCGYRCSEGHTWSEKQYNSCPSCDWTNKPAELVDEEELHAIQDIKVSQMCQADDIVNQMKPLQDSVSDSYNRWKDELDKVKPEDIDWTLTPIAPFPGVKMSDNVISKMTNEGSMEEWAKEQLAKIKLTPEEEKRSFTDMLIGHGQMYHIGDDGIRYLDPHSQEYSDALDNWRSKGNSHKSTELMSLQEIVDKYGVGLTEDELQKLKQIMIDNMEEDVKKMEASIWNDKPAGNEFYDRIKKDVGEDNWDLPSGYSTYIAGIDPIQTEEDRNKVKKVPDEIAQYPMIPSECYTAEDIERIRREGINADQQDKSPYEEYIDAIASKRIVDEYDRKTTAVNQDAPQSYNLLNRMNEKPPVYEQH